MMYLYYLLFVVGLVFYALALANTDATARTCYSNTGDGVMLVTAVLLLFRVAWKLQRGSGTPG
ncbi:MAG: hypothetical protein HZC42_14980 [Candidatus Eisenbacteria bacterium]|nr:hypothetical protein [Candidatus Eisenbacteria bacterium]